MRRAGQNIREMARQRRIKALSLICDRAICYVTLGLISLGAR
jgi:hypothetical protein